MLLRVVHWPPCLVHLGKKRFWKQSWQYCRRCRNFGLCLSAFFSIISFEPFFFPQSILAHLISGFPSTTSHKSLSYYSLFSTHHPSALFPFFLPSPLSCHQPTAHTFSSLFPTPPSSYLVQSITLPWSLSAQLVFLIFISCCLFTYQHRSAPPEPNSSPFLPPHPSLF